MKHSKKFTLVKHNYELGLWSKRKVYDAVGRWIEAWEYEEITGEEYA